MVTKMLDELREVTTIMNIMVNARMNTFKGRNELNLKSKITEGRKTRKQLVKLNKKNKFKERFSRLKTNLISSQNCGRVWPETKRGIFQHDVHLWPENRLSFL